MEQSLFRNIPTYLDLNGPNLSFTVNPSGTTNGNPNGSLSLIGIATASFPNVADNAGSLAYQWYEVGVGKLTDGGRIAGSATTTLTISNLVTPDDNGRQFYLEADYVPAQYITGNALNEPLNSGIGSITVSDVIEIATQTIPVTGVTSTSYAFNIASNLSGDTENLSYQWQIDGTDVSDGTIEKKTVDVLSSTTVDRSLYANNGSGSFPHSITDFGGTGEYRIWSNPNTQASYWDAGQNNGGVNGITEADRILCAEQCSTTTGTQVELGDFAENLNGLDQYKIDVVSGINSIRVTEQTFTYGSFTIPANAKDIRLDLGAGCGGRGADTHLHSGGNGGDGMSAWFSIPTSSNSRILSFDVGRNGNDGIVGTHQVNPSNGGLAGNIGDYPGQLSEGFSGGNGASSGSTGLNGSGGGGGAPTTVRIDGVTAIVLGGGAGGGGASESGAGTNGADAGPTSESVPFYGLTDSDSFSSKNGVSAVNNSQTGAGGGGAGGGAIFTYNSTTYSELPAGTSGSSATGGSRGHSAYKTSLATYLGGSYNRYEKSRGAGSGWAFLSYTTASTTNTNDTKTTTVSGAETASLTLNTDKVGVAYTVGVQITATASNSPLTSDIVGYNVVSQFDQALINIEAIGITTSASLSTINLSNGPITLTSSDVRTDNTNAIRNYVLYSPERDIDVEMDMYGGMGNTGTGGGGPGNGGFSRIRFTIEKNVEYVVTGLSTAIGSPALYRKASLLARVGQGGSASKTAGNGGGNGGGVGIAGDGGGGSNGGVGGGTFGAGGASTNGTFGSIFQSPTVYSGDGQATAPWNGLTIACTKGIYWAQQGKTPCEDLGSVQFRLGDGSLVSNTTSTITRGYKDGYNIIETAGIGVGNGGNGGNGAIGGVGGGDSSGGGGGSGYTSGSVTVVTSTLGGGTGDPRVILRLPGTL